MKIVTLGEILLRLSPEGYLRFAQANKFDAVFGGGEANVAVSLSQLGEDASFVTKLPENDVGQACIYNLKKWGVNTSCIVRGGSRMGIYFLERGASQRPSQVIYDRIGSSFALARAEEFDWDSIMNGVDWFHFTGVTPALGKNIAELTLAACRAAKQHGATVSCDLNYRNKLWSKLDAVKIMDSLMKYADVFIGNEYQATDLFGGDTVNTSNLNRAQKIAELLMQKYPLKKVALTFRRGINSKHNWFKGMLYNGKTYHFSREYEIEMVDRVGGGDAFAAGLIYALGNNYQEQASIEFAVAASVIKHTVEGDGNVASKQEIERLADSGEGDYVQR